MEETKSHQLASIYSLLYILIEDSTDLWITVTNNKDEIFHARLLTREEQVRFQYD